MTRLLALFFLAWTVYQLVDSQVRRFKEQLGAQKGRTVRGDGRGPTSPPRQLGELVPCERCGVHVARSKAIRANGAYFCAEHGADPAGSGRAGSA